jgi:hypothetical protein
MMKNLCPGTGRVAVSVDQPELSNLRVCPVCRMWTIPFKNGRVRGHNDLRTERERDRSVERERQTG